MRAPILTCLLFSPSAATALKSLPRSRGLPIAISGSNTLRLMMTTSDTAASATAGGDTAWFKDGLSFTCSMCGNCCSGSSGSVRFSESEANTISTKLGVDVDTFYAKYTRKVGKGSNAHIELKETRYVDRTYDCIFLDRKTIPGKKICSLYEARYWDTTHKSD